MSSLVSVIVPCFNQAAYLEEAIDSVVTQSYQNWECIIVNDGSTDNTEEIAQSLVKNDKRLKYFYKPNGGLASARNYAIDRCAGKFVLPLDADDKIHPAYLEKAVDAFKKEEVKIVYCDAEYFGARKGKLQLPDFNTRNLAEMNMIFCTAFFRKCDFEAAGGYDPKMVYGWEDWNLWVAILKNGGEVVKIPEVLFYYRIKKESMLTGLEGVRKQKMFMQLYLNHPDFFDRFHNEPIDIFDNYTALKAYAASLQENNQFLKGLIKLQPKAYRTLISKVFKRVKGSSVDRKSL